MNMSRAHRAGESLEDYCRGCKADRLHTIVVVDADSQPLRVVCGFCHSEHNYRGGGREGRSTASPAAPPAGGSTRAPSERPPFPIVSDRERAAAPMTSPNDVDFE